MIGHEIVGSGARRVIVLNDWIGDVSTWDGARPYFDGAAFTYALADVRGYGRSRGQTGAFTLEEIAGDVLALADALGWPRFSIVGHSMTSLVALHLGQTRADRIERVVLLAPPPPAGFGADDAMLEGMRGLARAADDARAAVLAQRWGERLSPGWLRYKVARWGERADRDAAAAYVTLFARRGLPDPSAPIARPVLAVTGEHDMELMRHAAVEKLLAPIAADLRVVPIATSGHYPMQEAPPLTVTIVERFLAG